MKHYEYQLVFFNRIDLRAAESAALRELNILGSEGWHVVHVREDPQDARDLAFFLEREVTATLPQTHGVL